jgi:hypothetical protein
MDLARIKSFVEARPFMPFKLVLPSDRELKVPHPEFISTIRYMPVVGPEHDLCVRVLILQQSDHTAAAEQTRQRGAASAREGGSKVVSSETSPGESKRWALT